MSLNEESQKRIWVLSQLVIENDDDFNNLISKMYLLSQVFKNQLDCPVDEEAEILKNVEKLSLRLRQHRMHKILRTQDNINSFKIEMHDVLSTILTLINPDIMKDYPIKELGK